MTTPADMHAALARLVNNEQTRKQEKIDQSLPKRSSREAELSPRGAAPRLVKRQRPPAITAAPPPADAWPVPAPAPEKRTRSGKPPLAFPPSPAQSPPLGIIHTIAFVVAAVAREAPRLGRAQAGGVGARREESNEERVLS